MDWTIHDLVTHAYMSFGLGVTGVLLSAYGAWISICAERAARSAEDSTKATAQRVEEATREATRQTKKIITSVQSLSDFTTFAAAVDRDARDILTSIPSPTCKNAEKVRFSDKAELQLRAIRVECSKAKGALPVNTNETVEGFVAVISRAATEAINHVRANDYNHLPDNLYAIIEAASSIPTSLKTVAVDRGAKESTANVQGDKSALSTSANQGGQ